MDFGTRNEEILSKYPKTSLDFENQEPANVQPSKLFNPGRFQCIHTVEQLVEKMNEYFDSEVATLFQ